MSLKAFHLFFIAVSIALCAVVATWGVREGDAGSLGLAAIGAVLGLALIVYGFKVFRKFQELGG